MSPFYEGCRAYKAGKDLEDNPYPENTLKYSEWWRGYQAEAEDDFWDNVSKMAQQDQLTEE